MRNLLKNICVQVAFLGTVFVLQGCSDSWLEPRPLSFYTPENTYINAEGLRGALLACERNMRGEFFGDAAPICTEIIQSDLAVEAVTDKAGPQMDMDQALLPDAQLNHQNNTRVGWYWKEGFNGIKYANTVISRIDQADLTEKEYNEILGTAYFHRAYRYFKLTHQFGNVPFIDIEFTSPKYDFFTYDRWSILERMKRELEFAYQWIPEVVDRGRTSKAACGVLLMKVCMALTDFDRAIEIGKEITAKHPLMTQRFTSNQTKPNTNLMFDLHSVEAKLDMTNTEGLMYVVAYPEIEGSAAMQIMRNIVPFWNSGSIKTPDGQTGTSETPHPEEDDPEMDLNRTYGRGVGHLHSTWYFSHEIWGEKEKNDLRGIYNRDSWKHTSDLRYNNPALKNKGNEWYGKNIVKNPAMSVEDTIRCWYHWPHYKSFVPSPLDARWEGGQSPWYVYRSAEVWLMLAECYYWKDDFAQAASALNIVRQRASANPLTSADINMGEILNERARELYYEENRHVELVRISYTYAKTGRPCEVFNGRVYKLDNISGPGGTNSNVKEKGYNFWFDWVNDKNNFYNKGVKHKFAEYKISVHHILWPVPANVINSNTQGVINQNVGYPGVENNKEPLKVPLEGSVIK